MTEIESDGWTVFWNRVDETDGGYVWLRDQEKALALSRDILESHNTSDDIVRTVVHQGRFRSVV